MSADQGHFERYVMLSGTDNMTDEQKSMIRKASNDRIIIEDDQEVSYGTFNMDKILTLKVSDLKKNPEYGIYKLTDKQKYTDFIHLHP
jgi:hypothetical protein